MILISRFETAQSGRYRRVRFDVSWWSSQKSESTGLIDRLSAIRGVEFAQDIGHVLLHRFFTDEEMLPNITVRQPGGNQPKHFHFALAQRVNHADVGLMYLDDRFNLAEQPLRVPAMGALGGGMAQ